MKPTDSYTTKITKAGHRKAQGSVSSSVPSPQDPFNSDSRLGFSKTQQVGIRPFEVTGQSAGRTTSFTPRKTITVTKASAGNNIKLTDRASVDSAISLHPAPLQQSKGQFGSQHSFQLANQRPSYISKSSSKDFGNVNPNMRQTLHHENAIRQLDEKFKIDEDLESFFVSYHEKPMHESIENFLASKIVSGNVIFWYEIASIQKLYSPKLDTAVAHNDAIVGFAFSNRGVLKIPLASEHFAYNEAIDGNIVNPKSALLLFPLQDSNDNVIGVVEIQKKFSDPRITEHDENFINEFMRKFKVFSHWLLEVPAPLKTIIDIMGLYEIGPFLLLFQKKMHSIFHCRHAEIWRFDINSSTTTRYVFDAEEIRSGDEGIVGNVAKKMQMFNCFSNKMLSSYFEPTDGKDDAALLAYPIFDKPLNSIFIIVLRGQPKKMFTTRDENILSQIAPFILMSFKNSIKFSDSIAKNEQIKAMSQLTQMLPSFGERLKPEDIIDKSMNLLEDITLADRTTLYNVDYENQQIKSIYAKDLKDPIINPITRGLSGHVVKTAKVHNAVDAYEDVQFDSAIDLITGYKTKSILTVPVIDAVGSVVSVIQLLNKRDFNPFNQLDIDATKLCGTICTCMINNANINHYLNQMKKKSSKFFSVIPDVINYGTDFKEMLKHVLPTIRDIVKAEKIVLYLVDHAAEQLVPFFWDGNSYQPNMLTMKAGSAASCAKSGKSFYINDVSKDGRIDLTIDNNFTKIAMTPLLALSEKNNIPKEPNTSNTSAPNENEDSHYCIAILQAIDKTKGDFDNSDLIYIQCIGTILSLFLNNIKLQSIIKSGKVMIKLDQLISPLERQKTETPKQLSLPENILVNIENLHFYAYEVSEELNNDYQILFYIFNKYNLLESAKIDNETMFSALYYAKSTYKETNYIHNWIHVIDMAQFLMYEIEKADLSSIFTVQELLSLFISVIFSYSDDDGTNNSFQVAARTPMGTLFNTKQQHPLTMAHCVSAIKILSKPKCNILRKYDLYDIRNIWKLIFKIMQAIIPENDEKDKLLIHCQQILKTSTVDYANKEKDKEALMMVLVRCADLAPYARPFGVHMKWQPVIMNSMFHLGDMEIKNGLDFSNRHNSRDHHIKALAMIENIQKFALPAFETLSLMKKEYVFLYETVKDNFQKWKDRR